MNDLTCKQKLVLKLTLKQVEKGICVLVATNNAIQAAEIMISADKSSIGFVK